MNFDLTEEQKGIQKAADEFAKGEFDKEVALELDRNHQYPFRHPEKGLQPRISSESIIQRNMAARDMESLKMP